MEKIEINLDAELLKRMDDVVELLAYTSREEMILAAVRRYVVENSLECIKAI